MRIDSGKETINVLVDDAHKRVIENKQRRLLEIEEENRIELCFVNNRRFVFIKK